MPSAFFLGVVHAPPGTVTYDALPDGYSLNRDELRVLQRRIPGVPLTVEHNGIHDAVDATSGPQGQLASRDRIISELHDLGRSDATKSPVGTVVEARLVEPSGGLYVIAEVNANLAGVSDLVRNGFMTGLSLSTVTTDDGLVPVEVSLTKEPARPHSYIVFSSSERGRVVDYLRRIEHGTLRDHSGNLSRPTRIMAASAEKMAVEAAAPPAAGQQETPKLSAQDLLTAVNSIPDSAARDLVLASLDRMGKTAQAKEDKAQETAKQIEVLKASLEEAQQAAKINSSMLMAKLSEFRKGLPEDMAKSYPEEFIEKAASCNDAEQIKAAWAQQLVTASLQTMQDRMIKSSISDEARSSTKRKAGAQLDRESSDVTTERMAAINTLISASASAAPSLSGAGPAVDVSPVASHMPLNADQKRMAAALKLQAALDAF